MKVVVLSDKKPGHYNQSLGIVQNMTECQMEWLEIQYRDKWRDNILRIFMSVCGGISLPASLIHSLLRWSLDATSYDALIKIQDADVILSTGSSVAAINLLLGKILEAKTVTSGRPSPIGIRHFDLAILPMLSWNRTKKRKNVCQTIGVPNPISVDKLNNTRLSIVNSLKLRDCPRIGILLGGTDRHETIVIEDAIHLFDICDVVATQLNAEILLTTSRRTPSEVTAYLKSRIETVDWCPLFVEPNTPLELDDPYNAILAISDLLIVSADSFSMVCESASSGRKVLVLSLSQINQKQPKRYHAYQHMLEQSIINMCTLEDLTQQITDAITQPSDNTYLQDTLTAVNAIRQLLSA